MGSPKEFGLDVLSESEYCLVMLYCLFDGIEAVCNYSAGLGNISTTVPGLVAITDSLAVARVSLVYTTFFLSCSDHYSVSRTFPVSCMSL